VFFSFDHSFSRYIESLNDFFQVSSLTGATMKSFIEKDGASFDVKGTFVKPQSKRFFLFITSNGFLKAVKKSNNWTMDDYVKVFCTREGRIGYRCVTEMIVPTYLRRQMKACRHCSARSILWLVAKSENKFARENDDVDHDSEAKNSDAEDLVYRFNRRVTAKKAKKTNSVAINLGENDLDCAEIQEIVEEVMRAKKKAKK
jgi:hypothetical protein